MAGAHAQRAAASFWPRSGVSKRFGVVRALDDVRLAVGRAKCSRSSARTAPASRRSSRIFEGVHQPDQGSLDGRRGVPQTFRSPADAHALGIRVIHQEPDIIPDLSIAENLFLGDFRRVGGVFLDRRDLARRTRAMLAAFGLENDSGPGPERAISVRRSVS